MIARAATIAIVAAACGGGGSAGTADAGVDAAALDDAGDAGDARPGEFIAQEDDFECILRWTKVRNLRVTNRAGRLDQAIAVARGDAPLPYPTGTIVQLFFGEAMVKRGDDFDPANADWEYFSLQASRTGTRILARGRDEVVNVVGGNCFSCHAAGRDFDFICEKAHGCEPLSVTDEQIAAFQQMDPRCP